MLFATGNLSSLGKYDNTKAVNKLESEKSDEKLYISFGFVGLIYS